MVTEESGEKILNHIYCQGVCDEEISDGNSR